MDQGLFCCRFLLGVLAGAVPVHGVGDGGERGVDQHRQSRAVAVAYGGAPDRLDAAAQGTGAGVVGGDAGASGPFEGHCGSFQLGPRRGRGSEGEQVECSAERCKLSLGHAVVAGASRPTSPWRSWRPWLRQPARRAPAVDGVGEDVRPWLTLGAAVLAATLVVGWGGSPAFSNRFLPDAGSPRSVRLSGPWRNSSFAYVTSQP